MANGTATLALEQLQYLKRCFMGINADGEPLGYEGTMEIVDKIFDILDPAIAEAKREDTLHGWVKASERLPTKRGPYLVCLLGMEWCDAYFYDGWHPRGKFERLLGVTHWQEGPPLPEPEAANGN